MGPKKTSPSPKIHSKAQAHNGIHFKAKVGASPEHLGNRTILVGEIKPKHKGSSPLGELVGMVVAAIPVTEKPLPKGSIRHAPKAPIRQKPMAAPTALGIEKTNAGGTQVHRLKLAQSPEPKVQLGVTPTATKRNRSQQVALSLVHKGSLKAKHPIKAVRNQVGQDQVVALPVGSAPSFVKGATIHASQTTTPSVLSTDVVQASDKPHSGWTARPVGLQQSAAVTTSVWQIQPPPIEGHHPWMMAVSSHNDLVQAQIAIHPSDANWALATGIGASNAGPGAIPVSIGISSGFQNGVTGWTMAGGHGSHGQSGGGGSSQDYGAGQWRSSHHSQSRVAPVRAESVDGVDLRI